MGPAPVIRQGFQFLETPGSAGAAWLQQQVAAARACAGRRGGGSSPAGTASSMRCPGSRRVSALAVSLPARIAQRTCRQQGSTPAVLQLATFYRGRRLGECAARQRLAMLHSQRGSGVSVGRPRTMLRSGARCWLTCLSWEQIGYALGPVKQLKHGTALTVPSNATHIPWAACAQPSSQLGLFAPLSRPNEPDFRELEKMCCASECTLVRLAQ